jgi:hypothetical protein
MNDSAIYFIAQYMRDPFRREGRNVGVIVIKGDDRAALFMGEGDRGVDLRRVQWMPYPKIYRRWVAAWRDMLAKHAAEKLPDVLTADGTGNYVVVAGGEVTDSGEDAAEKVCQFLFQALVLKPEEVAVDEERPDDTAVQQLKREIDNAFRQRAIMGVYDIPHPILSGTFIQGHVTTHSPAYVQQNERLSVMEPVNVGTASKHRARDHAGYAAAMFGDINDQRPDVQTIAIIHGSEEDRENDIVAKMLELLRAKCLGGFVNWTDERARGAFLDEREKIARGANGRQ